MNLVIFLTSVAFLKRVKKQSTFFILWLCKEPWSLPCSIPLFLFPRGKNTISWTKAKKTWRYKKTKNWSECYPISVKSKTEQEKEKEKSKPETIITSSPTKSDSYSLQKENERTWPFIIYKPLESHMGVFALWNGFSSLTVHRLLAFHLHCIVLDRIY